MARTGTGGRNGSGPDGPGGRAEQQYRAALSRRRRRVVGAGAGVIAAWIALVAAGSSGRPWARSVLGSDWPWSGRGGLGILLMAGLSAAVAARAWWAEGDVRRWLRGADGERRTADLLSVLARRRWGVWHDLRVPASRANIDHLVVGRTGVWVVDTKTTRAALRSGWRSVRLGDRRLDTGAVRWEASMAAAVLADAVPARAVRRLVAVHGPAGELRRRGVRVGGVRVVPAEAVVDRIRRGRRRLSRREIRLACAVAEEWAAGGPRRTRGTSPAVTR